MKTSREGSLGSLGVFCGLYGVNWFEGFFGCGLHGESGLYGENVWLLIESPNSFLLPSKRKREIYPIQYTK